MVSHAADIHPPYSSYEGLSRTKNLHVTALGCGVRTTIVDSFRHGETMQREYTFNDFGLEEIVVGNLGDADRCGGFMANPRVCLCTSLLTSPEFLRSGLG